jgi:hypothetical protein
MGRSTLGRMTKVAVGLTAGLYLAAAPAWADVTITSTQTGKMAGGDGIENVQRIKGGKMRTDLTKGTDKTTIIIDAEGGKMIMIDHKKKEATSIDVAAVGEAIQKVGDADVQATLTPTSETKQVAGYACTVYQSDVKVNFSPGEGMAMKILMTGPVCVSKTAPGMKEYAQFYTTAVDKGFIFGDPRVAKAQPGMAKGFAKLYKAWADAGVPLSNETTLKFDGAGMLTGMMNKMMGGATIQTVSKIDTAAIDDAEFQVPAGYKVKTP